MKKLFLLIPAMGMLLTGCGEEEQEEKKPLTYDEVGQLVARNLGETYKKAINGLSLGLEISGASFSVNTETIDDSEDPYESSMMIDVKDFGFKLNVDVRNLTKSYTEWEAAIVLEDLTGTINVKEDGEFMFENLSFSDVDFAIYLKQNTLYAHLGDTEFLGLINKVVETMGLKSLVGPFITEYGKDMYLPSAFEFILGMINGDSGTGGEVQEKIIKAMEMPFTIPAEIPAEVLKEVAEEIPEALTSLSSMMPGMNKLLSFELKDDGAFTVSAVVNNQLLPALSQLGLTLNASASVSFGKDGVLSGATFGAEADITMVESTVYGTLEEPVTETVTTHAVINVHPTFSVSYPTSSINMPDFTSYVLFEMPSEE